MQDSRKKLTNFAALCAWIITRLLMAGVALIEFGPLAVWAWKFADRNGLQAEAA